MLSLINKSKWLLSGNFLFALSQWIMLIFFSQFGDATQLGYYSYALAVTAPVFMLTNLQLRPLLVADANLDNKFKFSQYFSLRLVATLFAILISFFFIDWNDFFAIKVFLVVILIKSFESISDIIYGHYNAQKKTEFISRSLIIKSCIAIFLSYLVLFFTSNIFYSLISTLIGYGLILVFLDLKESKINFNLIKFFDIKIKEIIILGLPVGIAVMLISIQANVPRYFLEYYLSIDLVGVYTIFYYFIVVGGVVMNSICQYLSPSFSEFYRDGRISELKKMVLQANLIAIFLGGIGLVLSLLLHGFIIKILYGVQYIKYSYLLPYFMIASIFTYMSIVSGYLLTSLNLLKIQVPIFISLLLFTLIYCYLLIPSYGLLGAVYSTIFSAMSQFLIGSFVVYKRIQGVIQSA